MGKSDRNDYLTRSIELLWGKGTPGSRGPKPQISVDQIARAGIRLADTEGLGAVSMQRVAAELGFTAMSLYTYVPSKDLLLEVMLDLAAETDHPQPEFADWRDGVHAWVASVWQLFADHPWVLQVQVSGPPLGPNQMAVFERLLTALDKSGLPKMELFDTGMFLLAAVRGLCKIALDMRQHGGGVSVREVDAVALRLVSAERFPTLHAVFNSAPPGSEPQDMSPDVIPSNLRYGLDRLLAGVEARVAYLRDRPREPAE